MADLKWEGSWDVVKGKAKQMWGNLTDDDLDVEEGRIDELIGRIKKRTGQTEDAVRDALERG